MTGCFKHVQRTHDVRFESACWIGPRDGGQALCTEMENMRRLKSVKDLLHALPIAQIALHKFNFVCGHAGLKSVRLMCPNNFPVLSGQKLSQVRSDKTFYTGYDGGIFHEFINEVTSPGYPQPT
jgi:hypothetical protein